MPGQRLSQGGATHGNGSAKGSDKTMLSVPVNARNGASAATVASATTTTTAPTKRLRSPHMATTGEPTRTTNGNDDRATTSPLKKKPSIAALLDGRGRLAQQAKLAEHSSNINAGALIDDAQHNAKSVANVAVTQQQQQLNDIDDEFDDEFPDDDGFDDALLALAMDRFELQLQDAPKRVKTYSRHTVLAVTTGEYRTAAGRTGRQKVLRLLASSSSSSTTTSSLSSSSSSASPSDTNIDVPPHAPLLLLRDDWVRTVVKPGAIVHVVDARHDPLNTPDSLIIDNTGGFLIVHPDTLISGTVVSDSLACPRRSVLSNRIKFSADRTTALLYGSMLHEIFQLGLQHGFEAGKVEEYCETVVKTFLQDLWCLGEVESVTVAQLVEMVPKFREWASVFLTDVPGVCDTSATVIEHRGTQQKSSLAVHKLIDIEENVWSPMFGLKGKVDATVQTKAHDALGGPLRTRVTPVELKTGKSTQNMSHRAQTSLYTLLLADRYDIDVDYGLLYYCRTNETIRVPAMYDEQRHLIMARNELAAYLSTSTKLPPVVKNLHVCQRCYNVDACMVYHKALERGTADTSGLGSLFEAKTAHLTKSHVDFLNKWEHLISTEEESLSRYLSEIWTVASEEREARGRCLSRMTIVERQETAVGTSDIGRHKYKLQRAANTTTKSALADNLLLAQLVEGDSIVVSTEAGHHALAIGFVIELGERDLIIAVDRELTGGPRRTFKFDASTNQDHRGLTSYKTKWSPSGMTLERQTDTEDFPGASTPTLYRIDRNEMTGGMGIARNNILALFTANGDERRRRLVVDLEEPAFSSVWRDVLAKESPRRFREVCAIVDGEALNVPQRMALSKVLDAKDYALVLGMPGTGKTTTIAQMLMAFKAMGKSVLLASYTHSAVDNILLKLKENNVDFLRLGNIDKIHSELHSYVLKPCGSVAELEQVYTAASVVAVTCLGVNHPIFSKRTFDVCIIDEASQITLPVCLGPLRCASTFVLVGDHYQLPPVVQSEAARQGGYADSLFKRLSEAHPNAVVALRHQYRMNEEVMLLSNQLIYDGKLECGSEMIARRRLVLTEPTIVDKQSLPWMRRALDPGAPVLFLNTDPDATGQEARVGELIQNAFEAAIIKKIIVQLLAAGVPPEEIGVISPYRSQLQLLSRELMDHPAVEVLTADRSQGRDKQCVLVSFVRSNAGGHVGELLRDWRRLNVTWTRAKTKLIMVGSKRTLACTSLCRMMLELVEERGWLVDVGNAQVEGIMGAATSNCSMSQAAELQENLKPRNEKDKTLTTGGTRDGILVDVDHMATVLKHNTILANVMEE